MATATLSGSAGIGSAIFSQIQTLQAQRAADQAEANARALRQRSDDAQRAADRAQENARSLKVRSDQADVDAEAAQRGLAGLESNQRLRDRLGDIYARVVATTESQATAGTQAAPAVVVTPAAGTPTTGTKVDTSA